jgi:F-type H+-transporting ATPase subunit epsilon
MAQDNFTLRVLTPAGLVFEEQVSSVSLPSEQGEIGLLPNHCRYTGTIGVGVLSYELASGQKGKPVVVAGGFCNFVDGKLVVLADSVDTAESMDSASIQKLKKEATAALEGLSSYDDAWAPAQRKLERAEAAERLPAVVH